MKVRLTVTVELDPKDWTATFGVEGTKEIREDVRRYVGNELPVMGVFGNGEVDAEITWR